MTIDSSTLIKVQVISQKGVLSPERLHQYFRSTVADWPGIAFVDDHCNDPDVVIVLNYLRYDQHLTARQGYIWRWDNEPIIRRPFPRGFDRIFTHVDRDHDSRIVTAPPVLDWWVDKSPRELASLAPPRKTHHLSAIASTKTDIEGHRRRNEFVDFLAQSLPDTHVYGRGRPKSLSDKWDGLAPYRYSVAIENTSKPDYWTEKISDCFLSFTVPFYFGATNISDYFPAESFVWLPVDEPDRALEIIRATLASDDWEGRMSAVREARRLVLEKYSLGAQISARVEAERDSIHNAPLRTTLVQGRRTKPGGWIRGQGLRGNIEAWVNRRRVRQRRHSAAS